MRHLSKAVATHQDQTPAESRSVSVKNSRRLNGSAYDEKGGQRMEIGT